MIRQSTGLTGTIGGSLRQSIMERLTAISPLVMAANICLLRLKNDWSLCYEKHWQDGTKRSNLVILYLNILQEP